MALFGQNPGLFGGAQSPKKMAGKLFWPPHMFPEVTAGTLSTTGALYYFVPFILEQPTTFAGAWCYNGGSGDNGDKFKIAAFSEAASGGPGALAKSFGEGTFTGAAALRQLAASWTASPGVYYLGFVTDNAVTMYTMSTVKQLSGAGVVVPSIAANTLGVVAASLSIGTVNLQPTPQSDTVAGTYANFPEATALTPTATQIGNATTPLFGLYT